MRQTEQSSARAERTVDQLQYLLDSIPTISRINGVIAMTVTCLVIAYAGGDIAGPTLAITLLLCTGAFCVFRMLDERESRLNEAVEAELQEADGRPDHIRIVPERPRPFNCVDEAKFLGLSEKEVEQQRRYLTFVKTVRATVLDHRS